MFPNKQVIFEEVFIGLFANQTPRKQKFVRLLLDRVELHRGSGGCWSSRRLWMKQIAAGAGELLGLRPDFHKEEMVAWRSQLLILQAVGF